MSSHDEKSPAELERRAREVFDQNVEQIPRDIRTKLAQARARALDEMDAPRRRHWKAWGSATTAVAAGAAAVAIVMSRPQRDADQLQNAASLEDLELLATTEEFEMMDELEFYAWVEDQSEWKG